MTNDYQRTDRMADLIEDNYHLLQVISRFGMSLGFGDKTVEKVCQMHQVDTNTFLAIINFMHSGYTQVAEDLSHLSMPALIDYLRQSHIYFLDYLFPKIRRELRVVLDNGNGSSNSINQLISKQFDKYISEVRKHMQHEDAVLFPYVEKLLQGEIDESFVLKTYSKHHHSMDNELRELKKILIKYSPQNSGKNELNAVLYEIYGCEDELDAHCKAEDYIFVPAVYDLEERVRHHANR